MIVWHDTSELSDALDYLGIKGVLLDIKPIKQGYTIMGPAFTVQYQAYDAQPATPQNAGNYIDAVPAGSIIVIDNHGKPDCTTWGDILTTVAQSKDILGTVCYGATRDTSKIRHLNYPLFNVGVTMRSGKNRVYKVNHQLPITIHDVLISPGDWVVGDDDGVLVIPKQKVKDVYALAQNIDETETRILNDVGNGMTLQEARELHNYARPWK